LRERGAAGLEFALGAPLLFRVVFGGIELGYMFRSHLALKDTARVAARVAAVESSALDAGKGIRETIQARAGDLNGTITRVVIYGAETLESEVPDGCTTGGSSQALKCNVYEVASGDSLQDVIDGFSQNASGLDEGERGPWDNVGVYIQYDYNYVTGFLDSITLGSSAVQVVELDL